MSVKVYTKNSQSNYPFRMNYNTIQFTPQNNGIQTFFGTKYAEMYVLF